MSKITNDGLTRSGTGCLIAVSIWQQWASKGFKVSYSAAAEWLMMREVFTERRFTMTPSYSISGTQTRFFGIKSIRGITVFTPGIVD